MSPTQEGLNHLIRNQANATQGIESLRRSSGRRPPSTPPNKHDPLPQMAHEPNESEMALLLNEKATPLQAPPHSQSTSQSGPGPAPTAATPVAKHRRPSRDEAEPAPVLFRDKPPSMARRATVSLSRSLRKRNRRLTFRPSRPSSVEQQP